MTEYQIHDGMPSGFSYADVHQTEQFEDRGVVNGASKVCLVRSLDPALPDTVVAVRLHPPKNFDSLTRRRALIRVASEEAGVSGDEGLEWYKREYNAGFAAGKRGHSTIWENGGGTHAWDDGFLDARSDRPKWHLSHCVNHDTCGLG